MRGSRASMAVAFVAPSENAARVRPDLEDASPSEALVTVAGAEREPAPKEGERDSLLLRPARGPQL